MVALRSLFWLLVLTTASHAATLSIPLPAKTISLDPTSVQDQSSLWVSRQLNCQLVRLKQGKVEREAILAYRFLSPTSIEMTLNPEYRFADGSAIHPDDVITTFAYLKATRRVLRSIFEWVRELRAVGSDRVVFELVHPTPHFLRALSSPNYAIFKKDFVERAQKKPELWNTPIGCGRYSIEHLAEDHIRLRPTLAKAPTLVFHFRAGKRLAPEELSGFDLISFDLAPKLPELTQFREVKIFDPYHIFIGLNTRLPRWKSRENRCRFFSKLDPSEIVAGYGDEGEAAHDLIPRGSLGYSSTIDYPAELHRNPLLTQGAPEPKFCLNILGVSVAQERRPDFVSMIRKTAALDRVLTIDQPKHYALQFEKSACDAMVLGLKSNYLDAYEYLLIFSERDANFTGYWNRWVQNAIRRSQTLGDSTKKAQAYQQILTKLRRECLVYPLVTVPNRRVYVKRSLSTPGLGEGVLNDYSLEKVR